MLFKAKKKAADEDGPSSSQTPHDTAKARRAQVRKAQIEHRQRKANYVKQLEIDVAHIRDQIAAAQTETRLLQVENNAMRSRLVAEAMSPQTSGAATLAELTMEVPDELNMPLMDPMHLDNADDMTLSLGLDATMNLPVYQITAEPMDNSYLADAFLNPLAPPEEPDLPYYPFAHLTPEQTHQVINFILA